MPPPLPTAQKTYFASIYQTKASAHLADLGTDLNWDSDSVDEIVFSVVTRKAPNSKGWGMGQGVGPGGSAGGGKFVPTIVVSLTANMVGSYCSSTSVGPESDLCDLTVKRKAHTAHLTRNAHHIPHAGNTHGETHVLIQYRAAVPNSQAQKPSALAKLQDILWSTLPTKEHERHIRRNLHSVATPMEFSASFNNPNRHLLDSKPTKTVQCDAKANQPQIDALPTVKQPRHSAEHRIATWVPDHIRSVSSKHILECIKHGSHTPSALHHHSSHLASQPGQSGFIWSTNLCHRIRLHSCILSSKA